MQTEKEAFCLPGEPLALPVADTPTVAAIHDWLARFAACVRDVDYAAGRAFWHPDIIIFGTHQELVRGLTAWTETQWDNVWPRTEDFAFDLANVAVLASSDGAMATVIAPWTSTGSTPMAAASPGRAAPPSRWSVSPTGAGSACIPTCRCNGECRRKVTASGGQGALNRPDRAARPLGTLLRGC